jgi:ClpP class serine protease
MIDKNLNCASKLKEADIARKNTEGRAEIKDLLQNTLAHFKTFVSKGVPMKWDDVSFVADKEGEEFHF